MGIIRNITSLLNTALQKGTTFRGKLREPIPFEKMLEDPGNFVYQEDGFEYPLKNGPEKIKWNDIDRLVAYKIDLLTTDEICLDILWGDRQITITEQTPGWYQFIEKTKRLYPTIPKDWDIVIIQPAFAENRTIIYQREHI